MTRAQSQLAPGITATTTDVIAGAEASAAFRSFVGGLKISGVFQGNPPRALINGRTYRTGELVDIPLGVAFDSADADKKIVTFKDRTGATTTRVGRPGSPGPANSPEPARKRVTTQDDSRSPEASSTAWPA